MVREVQVEYDKLEWNYRRKIIEYIVRFNKRQQIEKELELERRYKNITIIK